MGLISTYGRPSLVRRVWLARLQSTTGYLLRNEAWAWPVSQKRLNGCPLAVYYLMSTSNLWGTRFVFMECYKWHSKMKVMPDSLSRQTIRLTNHDIMWTLQHAGKRYNIVSILLTERHNYTCSCTIIKSLASLQLSFKLFGWLQHLLSHLRVTQPRHLQMMLEQAKW